MRDPPRISTSSNEAEGGRWKSAENHHFPVTLELLTSSVSGMQRAFPFIRFLQSVPFRMQLVCLCVHGQGNIDLRNQSVAVNEAKGLSLFFLLPPSLPPSLPPFLPLLLW
jgi:hypothetical protein